MALNQQTDYPFQSLSACNSLSRDAEDTVETLTTLTKTDTEKFLRKAINDQEGRNERAEKIISQVGSWNLNLKGLFGVKDAPFSKIPLRMLRSTTKSGLQNEKNSIDSFIAVSYKCPTPEWPKVKDFIESPVEGKQIPISKLLWHFLLDMRESDQEGIWIDQICIDQGNEKEKASAIAAMDALYASARLVFILLEDVTQTHDEFTDLSEAFRQVSTNRHFIFDSNTAQRLFEIVSKIFSARWFSRAWCFHEYHMTRNRMIALRVEPRSTKDAVSVVGLVNLGDFVYCLPYFENEELRQAKENQKIVRDMLRFFAGQGSAYSNIIRNTFWYGSEYLRDRMSITINLLGLGISVDKAVIQKHEDEGCMNVLMLALAAGDGTILTTPGEKLRFGENLQKVSWCQRPDETGWSSRHQNPEDLGFLAMDAEFINLNLYFLDEDHFHSPTTEALARAEVFLFSESADKIRTKYGLVVSPASEVGKVQRSDNHQASTSAPGDRSIFVTQACGLDCGRSWMIKAWARIEDEVGPEVDENYSEIEDLPTDIDRSLFPGEPEGLEQSASSTTVLKLVVCLLLFGKYWEIGTWVSTRATGEMALCDLGREGVEFKVPLTSEHKLYGLPVGSLYDRSDVRLAIPQAIASETFGMSDRFWLLERVGESDGSCWRIRNKVALIGCGAIHEDGKIVILKENQRTIS